MSPNHKSVTNLHKFKTIAFLKFHLWYSNFVTTFTCFNLGHDSPRTVSVEVLTLPVAAKLTLPTTVHVQFRGRPPHNVTVVKNDFVLQAGGF